jgi:hypothetical protein
MASLDTERVGAERLKSPERFMRKLLGGKRRNWKVKKERRREISLCAGRPLRGSEAGRKTVGLLRSK